MIFTDKLIKELVSCPKKVIDAPRDFGFGRESNKTKFLLDSVDGLYSFSGFISKNLTFQENYSIGLIYNPKEEKGEIVLLRVNGHMDQMKMLPIMMVLIYIYLLQRELMQD